MRRPIVYNAAQLFLDAGRAQAINGSKILTELTSGCCFGEMAFLASCNKVLRRRNSKDQLATRVCDGTIAFARPRLCLTPLAEVFGYDVTVKAVEVTRVLELTVRDFLFVVEPRENAELQDALGVLKPSGSWPSNASPGRGSGPGSDSARTD